MIGDGARRGALGGLAGIVLGLAPGAVAMPPCHGDGAQATAGEQDSAATEVKLVDLALLDQDGRERRFASEVVGDRIVVIDFVYTSCTTVCPVLSASFARLQSELGRKVGREVLLVSVSLDPERDTPARLKAFSARHGARDGWVWLTGPKDRVERVLQGLGATTSNFADHPPMVLVGDGRTGTWSRFNGFPDPERLGSAVDALLAARTTKRGAR